MGWRLKTKKSAGVPVTAAVYDNMRKGNSAREAKQWLAAANFYGAALAEEPTLFHAWIQLGHTEKEAERFDEAEAAYLKAAELRPVSGEPHLHLGHLFKLAGKPEKAMRSYYEASRREPDNADAVAEFTRLIAQLGMFMNSDIADFLKASLKEENEDDRRPENALNSARTSLKLFAEELPGASTDQRNVLRSAVAVLDKIQQLAQQPGGEGNMMAPLVFDASDLIGYYAHARLPTGIQRVQIEAISSALMAGDKLVKICCFIDGRDDWLEVPVAQFRHITQLSVKSGERNDPEWTTALNRLNLTLALAEPFEFPDRSHLVNLGTSWWQLNYFLFVRRAKAKHGIRYIPFVHDLIPIMTPEHCVRELTQNFISWAIGVFDHADYFLVNSEATKRDLLKVAGILGHVVNPDDVAVIRLDADFRKPETRRLNRNNLGKWGLDEEPFVLFVSTVESRKGHIVALDAWLELIHRHGVRRTPRLVCVGNNGWLNDAVYQRLAQNDELAKRVTMLSHLSDEELALLYRSCRFTIYPSLYEGWGLPITESLCYGKPVVAADSSSLPEAGGEFAVFVRAGSPLELADAVEKMSFDTDYRASIETKIVSEFRPRTWHDVAHQIDDEIIRLVGEESGRQAYRAPRVKLGAYHPITRNVETRIWPGFGSGEIFRTGLGWLWPDTWGCWTRPQGGGLAIGLPERHGLLRVYLLLKNFPGHDCPWRLRIKGLPTLRGRLLDGEERWVSFDYPMIDDGDVLRMNLRGERTELIRMSTNGSEKDYLASVGLRGFFICEADDAVSRTRLLEATAFGNVAALDAYREMVKPLDVGTQDGSEEWDDDI
jgi:glycosyltransferase involved in cell wall biosynthesis/Tfp pilus assembly protein PilF